MCWFGGIKIKIKKKIQIQAVGQKNEKKARKWRGKFYSPLPTFLFSLKAKISLQFQLTLLYTMVSICHHSL
jgi:hypothetical protein